MKGAARDITEKGLDALRPGDEIRDGRTPGFGARCRASGRVHFFFRYRAGGEVRIRLPLGRRTARFGLADARRAAEDLRRKLDAGADPAAERAAAREALAREAAERKAARARLAAERRAARERRARSEAEPGSFADLADRYLAVRARKLSPRWRREVEAKSGRLVELLGSRKLAELGRRDLVEALDRIDADAGEKVAEVHRKILRAILGWALEREEIDANPCPARARVKRTQRERHLSESEIRALWQATEELDPVTGGTWRLILLTGQRPGSVKAMRREDLALDGAERFWLIPARYMKSGKPHRVHLSAPAWREIARLDEITGGSPWVFESPRPRMRGGRVPKRWNARATSGHLEHLQASTRALNRRVAEIIGHRIEPFTPHDLRRTAATLLSEAGVAHDVIDKLQAHALEGVRKVYIRAELEARTREALDVLGRELARILADKPKASKVRPLRRRGGIRAESGRRA
jgi:integrase